MEGHPISAGPPLPHLDLKDCGCHASLKGVFLAGHLARVVPRPHDSRDRVRSTVPNDTEEMELADAVRYYFRLFKFPQMDFEMAIWEMTSLLIAPKKVFRSIYYHVWLP